MQYVPAHLYLPILSSFFRCWLSRLAVEQLWISADNSVICDLRNWAVSFLLIATFTFRILHFNLWIAPGIPNATYILGWTVLPVCHRQMISTDPSSIYAGSRWTYYSAEQFCKLSCTETGRPQHPLQFLCPTIRLHQHLQVSVSWRPADISNASVSISAAWLKSGCIIHI